MAEAEEKEGKEGKEGKPKRTVLQLYEKRYKLLLAFPLFMLLISLVYIASFYAKTGDVMTKDVTLTGGTTITIFTEEKVVVSDIEGVLAARFKDVVVRVLTDLRTGKQIAFSIEAKVDTEEIDELKTELESYLGYALTEENSSMEFTGTALSKSFYRELIRALIIAFVLMAIVVFVIFRVAIPSLAVILSAFTDIVVTLAVINLIGIRLSTAGIAAFLMLVGYSVDTDIMLTTRLLKRREKELIARLKDALRTGLTMTLTSMTAVFVAYLIVVSPILKQVFLILTIGLFVDIIATWFGNATILKWYCDKKHIT